MAVGDRNLLLAVVTAFMNDPDTLLLDEPTSGLDPVMQEIFIDFIRDEKKNGKTILLSSHIFSEVKAVCDRIAIIKDGRLVSTVNAGEVKHGLKNVFTLTFADESSYDKFVNQRFEFEQQDKETLKCSVVVDDGETNQFISVVSECNIKMLEEHSVSLEEYFMHFYKNDKSFGGVQK